MAISGHQRPLRVKKKQSEAGSGNRQERVLNLNRQTTTFNSWFSSSPRCASASHRQSEAIRGNQRQSEMRQRQRPSEAVEGT